MKLNETVDKLIGDLSLATQQEIKNIQRKEKENIAFLNAVKLAGAKLEETLAKEHLSIVKFFPCEPKLGAGKIALTVKPTSTKFKFIKDAGYTKSGSGKNQDKLNLRAHKLSESIKNATGIKSVSVNPFCFEYNKYEETAEKTLLIDLWIDVNVING